MFVQLNSAEDNDWPNILLVGDTASVFHIMGLLSTFKLNVFIADTGIEEQSPSQSRIGQDDRKDAAGVYYDFFDSPCRIGAGIIRRFNMIVHTTSDGYLQAWARRLRVPAVMIRFLGSDGAMMEMEGTIPDPEYMGYQKSE